MTEMRDAVSFMCTFLDFKRVVPATTAAGVQSQPFSFTVAHVMRNEKKGCPFLPFCEEQFSISSDPLLRSKDGFFLEHKSLHSLQNISKGKDNEMQHQLFACKSPFLPRPCPGSEDPHPK